MSSLGPGGQDRLLGQPGWVRIHATIPIGQTQSPAHPPGAQETAPRPQLLGLSLRGIFGAALKEKNKMGL